MLKSFLNKFGFQKSPKMEMGQRPDFNRLIVMNADRLIEYTGQQGRIRHLKRIIMLDDTSWQYLYLDVIERYAELVQLMPASQAHHHTVPGGLFIHTLEVLEYALSIRKQYKLPTFATEKEQEDQRHMWTYAVFAAVILHDVAKRITMCRFVGKDGVIEPFTGATLPLGSVYRIEFLSTKYYPLHQQLGLIFAASLFPPAALNMLGKHLNALEQVLGYIHGDNDKAGAIGEIISKADQLSTKESLEHSTVRKFDGATLEHIGERLMTCLRRLLASNHFAVNRNNGNVYTTADGYTYILSKTLADALRDDLKAAGQTDIPSDNNRIFDIFGEYNFAERDGNGRVMHYIKRTIQNNTHTFSVLKFQTNRLFRIAREPFTGMVTEVPGHEKSEATSPSVTKTGSATDKNSSGQPGRQYVGDEFSDTDFPWEEDHAAKTVPDEFPNAADMATADSCTETEFAQRTKPGTDADMPESPANEVIPGEYPPEGQFSSPVTVTLSSNNDLSQVDANTTGTAMAGDSNMELGASFLRWCRKNIKKRTIVINESRGLINKIVYKGRTVVAVISPRAFLEFAESIGLPGEKAIIKRIQNSIHQLKLNIPGPRGQLHHYQIKRSENNPLGGHQTLYLYLFEVDSFCGTDMETRQIIDNIETNTNLMPSVGKKDKNS